MQTMLAATKQMRRTLFLIGLESFGNGVRARIEIGLQSGHLLREQFAECF